MQVPVTRDQALQVIWNHAPDSERKIENGHRMIRMCWDPATKEEMWADMERVNHHWIALMLEIVEQKQMGFRTH
jgi:hypothetical protein